MQKRYQSKVMWTSLFALLFFLLKNYGLFDTIGLSESAFTDLTNLLITFLIAIGIVNDPHDANKI